jgi:hypothetical protein
MNSGRLGYLLALAAAGIVVSVLTAADPAYAQNHTCNITDWCGTAQATCLQSQSCVCKCDCSPSFGRCECHCEVPTGGGGGAQCKGQICTEGVTIKLVQTPLSKTLKNLTELTGMKFLAPDASQATVLDLDAKGEPFESLVHGIAGRIDAMPVFLSQSHTVEFVRLDSISSRRFSSAARTSEPVTATLEGVDIGTALRDIATTAGLDLVLKDTPRRTVDGSFGPGPWNEVMDSILAAAGVPGHAVLHDNGLVEVSF